MKKNENTQKILNTPVRIDCELVAQEAGVSLVKDGKPLSPNWTEEFGELISKVTMLKELPVSIEVGMEIENLMGISNLIKKLRELLFSIDTLPDKRRDNTTEFSEEFKINKTILEILLSQNRIILKQYVSNLARISLLLEVIKESPKNNQDFYQEITDQLETWKEVLTEILPNIIDSKQYQEFEEENETKFGKKEKERLKKLITGERDYKDKKRLKKRIKNILLGSTAFEHKTKVTKDISDEFLRTALAVNEMRLVHRVETEENIDLIEIRSEIKKIQNEYKNISVELSKEEKEQTTHELNNKIKKLLIPISNAVAEIFPHDEKYDATLLSTILAKSKATCAGKSSILVSIFKVLGLDATQQNVARDLYDTAVNHSCCEVSLLSGKKLIVDANYDNSPNRANESIVTYQDYLEKQFPNIDIDSLNKFLDRFDISQANAQHMSKNTFTLVYSISPLKNNLHLYKLTKISINGIHETWFASIPHPHLVASSDVDNNHIGASTMNNYGVLEIQPVRSKGKYEHALQKNPHDLTTLLNLINNIKRTDPHKAKELLLKAIQIDPKRKETYIILAKLLKDQLKKPKEAIDFLYKALHNLNLLYDKQIYEMIDSIEML